MIHTRLFLFLPSPPPPVSHPSWYLPPSVALYYPPLDSSISAAAHSLLPDSFAALSITIHWNMSYKFTGINSNLCLEIIKWGNMETWLHWHDLTTRWIWCSIIHKFVKESMASKLQVRLWRYIFAHAFLLCNCFPASWNSSWHGWQTPTTSPFTIGCFQYIVLKFSKYPKLKDVMKTNFDFDFPDGEPKSLRFYLWACSHKKQETFAHTYQICFQWGKSVGNIHDFATGLATVEKEFSGEEWASAPAEESSGG